MVTVWSFLHWSFLPKPFHPKRRIAQYDQSMNDGTLHNRTTASILGDRNRVTDDAKGWLIGRWN
jgi:hypothetical protein